MHIYRKEKRFTINPNSYWRLMFKVSCQFSLVLFLFCYEIRILYYAKHICKWYNFVSIYNVPIPFQRSQFVYINICLNSPVSELYACTIWVYVTNKQTPKTTKRSIYQQNTNPRVEAYASTHIHSLARITVRIRTGLRGTRGRRVQSGRTKLGIWICVFNLGIHAGSAACLITALTPYRLVIIRYRTFHTTSRFSYRGNRGYNLSGSVCFPQASKIRL